MGKEEIITRIINKINSFDTVYITGHKHIDLDALGANLGLYEYCVNNDIKTTIILKEKRHEKGISKALEDINKDRIKIMHPDEINHKKTDLLIILDTNSSSMIQDPKLVDKFENIIVIDHHFKFKNSVEEADVVYINNSSSSTVEIIIDILKETKTKISKTTANIMLAGIEVDTNEFNVKTTEKTYEAAAFLASMGANSEAANYYLEEDFSTYQKIQEILLEVNFYKKEYAILIGKQNKLYNPEDLAKISDDALTLEGVEAAFAIGKLSKTKIGISARSSKKINVLNIMKVFNGGGHINEAASQINGASLKTVEKKLKEILNETR